MRSYAHLCEAGRAIGAAGPLLGVQRQNKARQLARLSVDTRFALARNFGLGILCVALAKEMIGGPRTAVVRVVLAQRAGVKVFWQKVAAITVHMVDMQTLQLGTQHELRDQPMHVAALTIEVNRWVAVEQKHFLLGRATQLKQSSFLGFGVILNFYRHEPAPQPAWA